MSTAMDWTEAIQNLFFGTFALSPNEVEPYIIFNHLRYQTQVNVAVITQQYYDTIYLRYHTLQVTYNLEPPQLGQMSPLSEL